MGIGIKELLVILLIIIVLFGSKKIPELMRGIGQGIKEFKKATNDDQNKSNSGDEKK